MSESGALPVWRQLPDAAAVAREAATYILAAADRAIAERGEFHLVLAGGTTPTACYRLLREADADWRCWHLWLGDERCLAADDPARNSRMIEENWLDAVALPKENWHRIPAEAGAEIGARRYSQALADIGAFDLVLLGLGEDGHVASLFPGHDWGLSAAAAALPVFAAPKPPPERISLSAERLRHSHRLLFLVAGVGKQHAVAAWRDGRPLPAAALHGLTETIALVDAAAWGHPIPRSSE